MNEGFDLKFEEDENDSEQLLLREKIKRILRNKKDWMNTLQITNKLKESQKVHYYSVNKQLAKLVTLEEVENITIPYGKKREMELWKIK